MTWKHIVYRITEDICLTSGTRIETTLLRQKTNNGWEATIASRAKGGNCPFCSNKRFKPGFNDVFTIAPQLEAEWDYERNRNIDPAQTKCSSTKKVWWICPECTHNWEASVVKRVAGQGCPICGRKKGLETRTKNKHNNGNTLAKAHPEIAGEWHPTKNGVLTPEMVTANNGAKVWWICRYGHEWEATVNHRAKGTGCPICADIERGKEKQRRVINLDTNEVFAGVGEAAKAYRVNASSLSFCLHGRTKRSGKPKCHWAFYDE